MPSTETAEIMRRFNQAFLEHQPKLLEDLIAPDCVMESIQPAPNGTRYEGYDACLAFWQAIATDPVAWFDVEDTVVMATTPPSAGASTSATAARSAASTSCGCATAGSSRRWATRNPRARPRRCPRWQAHDVLAPISPHRAWGNFGCPCPGYLG